jgi:CHAD domain-containing protein
MAETLQRERTLRANDALPLPKFEGAVAPGKAHSSPAQRAVAEYLNAQIDGVVSGDMELCRGVDPIHDTTVAIRRMRNTLLGIEGPARSRVTDAMDSERYVAMMAVLRGWRTEPPLKERFGVDELRKYFKKARRKADRRLAAAVGDDDDAVLHSARKAAKRARYAGELCGAVRPPARRKAKAYKKVQSVLGDHQDTVVARDVLRRMAAGTGPSQGQNGFTYGLLYAREQQIAAERV